MNHKLWLRELGTETFSCMGSTSMCLWCALKEFEIRSVASNYSAGMRPDICFLTSNYGDGALMLNCSLSPSGWIFRLQRSPSIGQRFQARSFQCWRPQYKWREICSSSASRTSAAYGKSRSLVNIINTRDKHCVCMCVCGHTTSKGRKKASYIAGAFVQPRVPFVHCCNISLNMEHDSFLPFPKTALTHDW